MANIVCYGEVLWDVFPSYKTIGGAPLNVALRLNSFNNDVTIISSVGKDKNGKDLIKYIKKEGLHSLCIQINDTYKTSEVLVSLDESGSASYEIAFPCAWDFIGTNKATLNKVKNTDAFLFGSLVARNKVSYHSLLELLDIAPFKVFDVNLRKPHYTTEVLLELMQRSDFIKFNDDELFEVCRRHAFESSVLEKNIKFISKFTNTETICVTLGEKGAVIYTDNSFYFNAGYKVKVKDTVGAGDSFLASLVHQLLRKETPQHALNFACAVGSIVASSSGANPKIEPDAIKTIMN